MRIALVLTPPTDQYFTWAAQVGVTDFVARYEHAKDLAALQHTSRRAAGFGLKLSVVEGYLPLEDIVLGKPGRDAQIAEMLQLIENMGQCGVPVLCYNFMPFFDMIRTDFNVEERGGALSNSYDDSLMDHSPSTTPITAAQLWDNLEYFLRAVLPAAEKCGVKLAMHPDDPPMPRLRGSEQIMGSVAAFGELVRRVPSPANGICFCQGTFAEMGVDIPATIRRLGPHIFYVHFRDVRGTIPHFVETFHDNGKTDMFAAMQAYHAIGYSGAMRPDHVPRLDGEEGDGRGYTMLGRLFAVGYMRGLMHAVQSASDC